MRSTYLIAAAAILGVWQAGAYAQDKQAPSTNELPNQQRPEAHSMRAHINDMLKDAGFTDIHIVPGSFLIHAKDKDGNPVVMNVGPDSFTEIRETDPSRAGGQAKSMEESRAGNSGSSFMAVPNSDELSSNVVGLDVYNHDNKNIGQIKDIAFNQQGHAQAYIVSVGGFLGIGDHYVAVNPSQIHVSYNDSDKKWHATMDATADQLKNAPEFKYTGRWNANKS
jgi:sporulation protein YlmC with PRC-barrel domain